MRLLVATILTLASTTAFADEGMWTFHDFPAAKVKQKYGFAPDQAWLDKARLASARIAGTCSASFVSGEGLVMTNHHCAHDCIAGLSTKDKDFVKDGFWAPKLEDEKKCPNMEIQRLDEITDVTQQVLKATAGKTGAAYTAALRDVSSAIEKQCQTSPERRCEVVNLYHGGQFMLHRYKRYTDVRLVFAPELSIAFFGGDPDNFEFPRYDLDVSFVRAYENGKPAATPEHFSWSPAGSKDGELVFLSGDPGETSREITNAERVFIRDVAAPLRIALRAEWRGELTQFMRENDEQRRIATEWQFYNENSLKAWKGRAWALGDKEMMKKALDAESALRSGIAAKPELVKEVGDAYDKADKALAMFKPYAHRHYLLEGWGKGDLLDAAIHLVRGADERALPNGKRLDEYRESALPDVEQKLASPAPVYSSREKLAIAFWLGKLREELGPDDPTVRALLGKDSPEQVAARLVDGSKLGDPAERMRLWKGGKAAVQASKDPMIAFVKQFDPAARKVRKLWDDEVDGVLKASGERIAKARFAIEGRSRYPDATFTLRLSYGAVKGYTSTEHGNKVAPFTYFAGAYDRATGIPPFALPKTWLDGKKNVDGRVQLDFATTNDIIGGNSGSPMFNQKLEVVGLAFDGNIESLAGDFWYDESINRTVGVSSEGLIHALSRIYHADRLVDELRPKKK
jgi:Peptidase S46